MVDAVLELLQPHTAWYAIVHRGRFGAGTVAVGIVTIVALVAIVYLQRVWAVLAFQCALTELILHRDRIFPAADIRVERPHERIATLESGPAAAGQPHPGPTEDRGTGESPDRARREPAGRDRDGIAMLSEQALRRGRHDSTLTTCDSARSSATSAWGSKLRTARLTRIGGRGFGSTA